MYMTGQKLNTELQELADRRVALAEKAYQFQLVYCGLVERRINGFEEEVVSEARSSEIRKQQEIEAQIYQTLCRQ